MFFTVIISIALIFRRKCKMISLPQASIHFYLFLRDSIKRLTNMFPPEIFPQFPECLGSYHLQFSSHLCPGFFLLCSSEVLLHASSIQIFSPLSSPPPPPPVSRLHRETISVTLMASPPPNNDDVLMGSNHQSLYCAPYQKN